MSYDLYFYKQKGGDVSKEKIANYLTDKLGTSVEGTNQWFFANEDTEVYFSFEYNDTDEEAEAEEDVPGFDNTRFSFNLNFVRPSFFGLEAFRFVEAFCRDLTLLVLNPQSGTDEPYRPQWQEQFEIWNKTNLRACKDYFDPLQSAFMSEDKSTNAWKYNFDRNKIQERLGEKYFVPKIFFFKTRQTNEVVTICSWAEHIPIVLPVTDYILLSRRYRKFIRIVADNVLISRATFEITFGSYFADFDFPGCRIISPDKAFQIEGKFNSVKGEKELTAFAERLAMENLYNARPE